MEHQLFMRDFKNSAESKSDSHSDCLYFVAIYKRSPKGNSTRSYTQAKALLQEHFGNGSEDVKVLQDYSLLLRETVNVKRTDSYYGAKKCLPPS